MVLFDEKLYLLILTEEVSKSVCMEYIFNKRDFQKLWLNAFQKCINNFNVFFFDEIGICS